MSYAVVINDEDYSCISSMSFISSSDDRCCVYNEQVQNGMNELNVLCLYSAKPNCIYQHNFSESADWCSCVLHRDLHLS